MSFNVTTGAHWERKEEPEEEEQDLSTGESKLFLNRKAQREYRINELFRRKAKKQFEKTVGAEDVEEDAADGGSSSGADKSGPAAKVEDDDDEEEDETKKRKRRKVCQTLTCCIHGSACRRYIFTK